MGNRVHSGPTSARHGGRHSTIVRCRSATSASTRTSLRTCSGTRARHHRWTRATSVSGRPDTPASLPSGTHPRCDDRWNPPDHVGARTLDDTQEPVPFPDKAFDDVVASLVLHYLGDWAGPLGELRRVLKPGGRLILSVNHPLVRVFTHPDEGSRLRKWCLIRSPRDLGLDFM